MNYDLIEALRANSLPLHSFLAQVEKRILELEPAIFSLVPEKNRFDRLYREAEALNLAFPETTTRPSLFGMLVGVKDIFHMEGFVTHAGSRLPVEQLQGPPAESVSLLKKAGALVLGKTITTEFAYFAPGPTRNPHNPQHTPGGSSSGSAAAVAAGFCSVALGTQTIGSIIRPAAFCGVIGFKPTYDRISRTGVIPLAPSLDHVGFFASDMETAYHTARALLANWHEPAEIRAKPVLGVPEGPYLENLSEEGRHHYEHACKVLSSTHRIVHLPVMPDFRTICERNDVIMSAEVAQVHQTWFEKYEDLYSERLSQLIRRGQAVTPLQIRAALQDRERFRAELRQIMHEKNIDMWICPPAPGTAPRGLESTGDPIMNLPWTQAGFPCLNLPAGKNQDGLPMGVQLVADWGQDEALLTWARGLEQALSAISP